MIFLNSEFPKFIWLWNPYIPWRDQPHAESILKALGWKRSPSLFCIFHLFFLTDFIYLFLEREEEGREREEKKHQCETEISIGCLSYAPQLTTDQTSNNRHVPWPGIELVTFRFADQHPTNGATPVMAVHFISNS